MRACGEPEPDPYSSYRSSWWGRAGRERRSGKRVWELLRWLRLENITWPLSGFLWDFERLCHVAANFQI